MTSKVYFSKTEDRKNFIRKVLEIFYEDFKDAKKIFIKPNLVSIEPYPTTTHPETLDCILEFLTDVGKDAVVGDGPAFDFKDKRRIFLEHPLVKVAEKYEIPFLNLYEHDMKVLRSERGYKIKLSTVPLRYDYIISLPILKTHSVCKITCALKNVIGYFSKRERIMIHVGLKNINRAIAEANSIIKTNLHIVDAINTMVRAQEMRHGGKPAYLGYMFAGKDPVALDSFGLSMIKRVDAELSGLKPMDILHLRYSHEIGLGDSSYETQKI
ncbi:MAG: DUF362 domain-containing protein [Candidatus Asgardarchaeia archaeon]